MLEDKKMGDKMMGDKMVPRFSQPMGGTVSGSIGSQVPAIETQEFSEL